MWTEKLEEIKAEKKTYGEKLNNGATKEELDIFKDALKKELDVSLPNEYETFLSLVNGIEFNGFILYGIDDYLLKNERNQISTGMLESNKLFYDNAYQKQYLFLGESSISWFVYKLSNQTYHILDNPSGSEILSFLKLQQLLEQFFTDALR